MGTSSKVRHLEDVEIVLSDTERKHLVLTGKNGSGKTSLLNAMKYGILGDSMHDDIWPHPYYATGNLETELITITFSKSFTNGNFYDFTFVHIPARRSELIAPKTVEKSMSFRDANIAENVYTNFIQYIIDLDFQIYGAQKRNDTEKEANLNQWFDNFRAALCIIYDCQELKFHLDAKKKNYEIIIPGREPFFLNEMSDGYASFMYIVMELLMRFETDNATVDYNQPAIVLIDEIEAHLHIALQKKILPFLTTMFPNVQFIVSTHSPFIINSLVDAVVYDLETNQRLENPSLYSYEAVVEGFFDVGQYSNDMKTTFARYKELYTKARNADEAIEFQQLITKLEQVPPASRELYVVFRNMEDKRKNDKN